MAKKTQKEGGVDYPATAYLYVPDPKSPSTWKLRYKNYIDGKLQLDPAQLGKAVAAFSPGGFRGQKVEMPEADKKKVMAKIRSIYTKTLKTKEADLPETLRSVQDMSFSDIRSALWDALQALAPNDPICIEEVYPDYVIYGQGDTFFKRSYSVLDDAVTLGENPVEVEETWIETQSAQAETDEGMEVIMQLAAKDVEGKAFDVTICEPGFTKNGWFIPEDILPAAAALFENVDVNIFELPEGKGATHLPDELFDLKSLLVKNKVAFIDSVKAVAGKGLMGVLHFLDSAQWLGKNILKALNDKKFVYGLSYDARVRAAKDEIDGKKVFKILKFIAADSVDIVTRPAAGGKFNRAVASMPAQNKEDLMKQKIWDLIKAKRPDLLKDKEFDKVSDDEMETLARMAMEPPPDGDGKDKDNLVTKEMFAALRCEMALKDTLAASDLPEVAKDRIRITFKDKVFKDDELTRAIAAEKEYLAKVNPQPGDGTVIPGSSVTGGLGSFLRACMAVDKLFGLDKATIEKMAKVERLDHRPFFEDMRSTQDYADFEKVPAFHSLREMYTFFTGDPEVTGRFNRKALAPELRSSMDINSATFTYVLGNTLGRRLVALYREMKYQEELLISIKKPVKDFRQQEAVLVGGFPDLSTVDPEVNDYQEIAGVTDEESTYSIGQKGNLLSISRKTIINDDISIIMRLIAGLSRAARRTHAKYVWNFAINNSNCTDATAWFTGAGAHLNLGTSALTYATALIAYKALAEMTEKDSGERLGLLDDPSVKPNLIGPIDIMETINKIATEQFYYSANDLTTKLPNPLAGKINAVVLSLLTDANDWYLILPPNVCDIIEMGYLNGREDPELFVADMPQSEQVFVADKIRHKIRHEYAGAVIDYRSGYKASV
ncbi:MAG: hypothetical protein ABSC54_00820 [Smithellaceae bacterium]|jgi:hypothetical protein